MVMNVPPRNGIHPPSWTKLKNDGVIGVLEATEHAFHPALVSKAGRSTQARAHYCLPLDDIADLLRQLIDGDHVPST